VHPDDQLNKDDWEELSHLRQLLKPIYEVSIHVQSVGIAVGTLHNTLTSIDYLLTYLKTRRN
jgi:hypothetical protein